MGVVTTIALADAPGDILVLHGVNAIRAPLYKEASIEDNSLIEMVNARTLPELLLSYEAARRRFETIGFTTDLSTPDPSSLQVEKGLEVVREVFESTPLTKTALTHARDAIEVWNYSNLKGMYGEAFADVKGVEHEGYLCTPLSLIVEGMNDLRRHALLLAWLVGKVDFATAHGLTDGDKKAKFKRIFEAKSSSLREYYKNLAAAPGNFYTQLNANAAVEQLHLYHPDSIESTAAGYVRSVFSLMLSDETMKMNELMRLESSFNTLLSAAWGYMAEGICKDDGPGSIMVCRRCGRFFTRKRKTAKYCSSSCRSMDQRDRAAGVPVRPDPAPTWISKQRRKS